jgi:hypothetical protein
MRCETCCSGSRSGRRDQATLKDQVAQKIGLDDRYFNSIMTHDFAMLCTIAKSVLTHAEGA